MWPADIILQNDSKSAVKLIHTSPCLPDEKCTYQGKTGYWKTAPPEAGTVIEAGAKQNIGTMDTVTWWDSPSWIYLQYASGPQTKLQVFVDMKGPAEGIWAHIDPYDPASTEDTPYPQNDRIELVTYDFSTRPNWTVTVHVPVQETWQYPKAMDKQQDTSSSSWTSGFVNAALSTLITVCFVIPPAAEIGVALSAISAAGKAAIALTAAQGILSVATSHGSAYVPAAFGANDAYASIVSALNKERVKHLKDAMDDVQSQYKHSEDSGGLISKLRSISAKVKNQLTKSNTVDFGDAILKADTAQCLDLLDQITNPAGPFQVALQACLNSKPSDALPGAPPDRVQISLAIAGLCMTFNAFADGYAIRSYTQASPDAEKLATEWKLGRYDADSIYSYLSSKLDQANETKVLELATAYRLSLLWFEIVKRTGQSYATGEMPTLPPQYDCLQVTDRGIALAPWGAATVKESDAQMTKDGMETKGKYVDGGARVWQDPIDSGFGNRSARAYNTCQSYGAFLSGLVKADVDDVYQTPLDNIKEAMVLYIANLRSPLEPHDAPEVKLGGSQPVPQAPQKTKLVQYGYSFVNARGVESTIKWAGTVELRVKDSQPEAWYTSAEVKAPKDPNNARADALAEKAKAVGAPATKIAPVGGDSSTKLLDRMPPYTSSLRRIYRRFWQSQEQVLTEKPDKEMELVTVLARLDEDTFTDAWDPSAL